MESSYAKAVVKERHHPCSYDAQYPAINLREQMFVMDCNGQKPEHPTINNLSMVSNHNLYETNIHAHIYFENQDMLSCFRKEWRDRKEIKETTSLLVPKDKATLIDLSTNKSTLIGTNLLVPTKCDPFGLVEEGEPSAGALFESLKESVSYVWFLPHDLLEEEGGEYVYGEESSRPAKEETTEMEESFSKFTDKMNESEFKCIWKYKRDFDSTSDPWKQLYSTLNSATNSTPNSTLNAVST